MRLRERPAETRESRPRRQARVARRWDQLLLGLLTRLAPGGARARFVFVTGFHHTGTTLVQAQLARQGVFTCTEEGSGGRPRELPLRHVHRVQRGARRAGRDRFMIKLPSNGPDEVRALARELRLLAPACTVAVCLRDPAATALSLAARHGWDAARARADAAAQQQVLAAWRAAARRHAGPVHFVALEAFSRDPAGGLRRILALADAHLPAPVRTAGGGMDAAALVDALPDPREHVARRRVQAGLPVYTVEADAWRRTERGEVRAVLEEIRERHGGVHAEARG